MKNFIDTTVFIELESVWLALPLTVNWSSINTISESALLKFCAKNLPAKSILKYSIGSDSYFKANLRFLGVL